MPVRHIGSEQVTNSGSSTSLLAKGTRQQRGFSHAPVEPFVADCVRRPITRPSGYRLYLEHSGKHPQRCVLASGSSNKRHNGLTLAQRPMSSTGSGESFSPLSYSELQANSPSTIKLARKWLRTERLRKKPQSPVPTPQNGAAPSQPQLMASFANCFWSQDYAGGEDGHSAVRALVVVETN